MTVYPFLHPFAFYLITLKFSYKWIISVWAGVIVICWNAILASISFWNPVWIAFIIFHSCTCIWICYEQLMLQYSICIISILECVHWLDTNVFPNIQSVMFISPPVSHLVQDVALGETWIYAWTLINHFFYTAF